MRYLSFILFLTLLFTSSCLTEQDAEQAQAPTFVRYFNGGADDVAVSALETADKSLVILANTEIKATETTRKKDRIKLIKTDAYGNPVWTKLYPAFEANRGSDLPNYRAHSIINRDNGGYVLVGEEIKNNGTLSQLLILVLNAEGDLEQQRTYSSTIAVSGFAVTINQNGHYLVLAKVNSTEGDMALFAINSTTLEPVWSRTYGSGQGTLVKKVFTDNGSYIVWGGTLINGNSSNIRWIKTAQNAQHTEFDRPFGDPGFNERSADICRAGNNFAIAATTNKKISQGSATTGDDDILLKIVSPNGNEVLSKSFQMNGQNETAYAINTTHDGFIILGSIESTPENEGRGEKDYLIIRTDLFGTVLWTKSYGSKSQDEGAHILELSDRSLLVLGTTTFGNVKTIMMMKMDGEGRIR